MVDSFVAIVVLTALGAGGGFLSSWMSWNASGEKFDGRKHGNALITGVIAGLVLGVGVSVAGTEDMTPTIFFILAITTFGTAVGIDRGRTSVSRAVANNPTLKEKNGTTSTNP